MSNFINIQEGGIPFPSSPQTPPSITLIVNSEINELYAQTNILQEFVNVYTYSLELEIYLYINEEILFDYFEATIEDSINITSKIIRKKEGQIKYNDNLSSGTPTIFVREDPDKKNRYIINMGSISPNERVIFKTKFINFIKFF